MSVPAGLLDAFAGVMLLVAAISAARLALSWRPASRHLAPDADVDVSHLLMGIAMAGTLTARLATLPALAWEIIFAVLTAWFAHRVTREYRSGRGLRALVSEHHAPHLLHSAAMLYMFLALHPAPTHAASAMAGMPAAGAQTLRLPTLALLFAFLLCAYVVADLDRLPAPRHSRPAPTPALALVGVGAPAAACASAPAALGVSAAAGVPASVGVPASAGLGVSAPTGASTTATPVTSPATAASPAPATSLNPGLGGLLSPGVARGCRIAMGVTMAFMLIIMI